MNKFLKILKLFLLIGLAILFCSSLNINVYAKELTIVNSGYYNKGLDLYTGNYFDTLIQDQIINATCDWSNYGCAIQVPIAEDQLMNLNQRYKISVLVSVPHGRKVRKPNYPKNLSFYKGDSSASGFQYNSLWRLYNYDTSSNFVFNADMEITYQSSSNNIDIYLIDYTFVGKSIDVFDIISIAFALDSSNTIQTGTLSFSYFMLDATNQDVINAVNDLKSNIDDVKNSVDDVNKSINDSSVPNFNQDQFLGYLPENALSSILNLPLNVLNSIQSNLTSSTCNDLVLPLPYLKNQSIKLECVSKLYQKMGFSNLVNSIGTLLGAFMLYNYLINLYKWVDGVLTFRENNWEGYD